MRLRAIAATGGAAHTCARQRRYIPGLNQLPSGNGWNRAADTSHRGIVFHLIEPSTWRRMHVIGPPPAAGQLQGRAIT